MLVSPQGMLMVIIDTSDRRDLVPGRSDIPATLTSLHRVDISDVLKAGATLPIWYAGRVVGACTVSRIWTEPKAVAYDDS